MGSKKRGLGRSLSDLGLSELLSDVAPAGQKEPKEAAATATVEAMLAETVKPTSDELQESPTASPENRTSTDNRVYQLPIAKIKPGRYQPRQYFDDAALDDLANSIKAQGIIQPIVVRRAEASGYELIAGERRWRAAQRVGLETIPAIIQDLPEQAIVAISLIENLQRENLNPIEEAQALDRLLHEFQLTHQEVADAVGKSRTTVTNLLRLMKLNPDVKILLQKGELDMGHARALLSLDNTLQSQVAQQVVAKQLSVRQTELLVKQINQPKENQPERPVDPNILTLQNDLSDKLHAQVNIRHQAKGKGQLVIHYASVEELQGILEHIQ